MVLEPTSCRVLLAQLFIEGQLMLSQWQLQIVLAHHNGLLPGRLFASDCVRPRHVPRTALSHFSSRFKHDLLCLDPAEELFDFGALLCLKMHKLVVMMVICAYFGGTVDHVALIGV